MPARLITPPAFEPVTLAVAKDHLRIEHELDDAYISALIIAARQYVEEICWRGLLEQTWEMVVDGFHGDNLLEQRRPVMGSWPTDWTGTVGHRGLAHWGDFIELPRGQLAMPEDDSSPVQSVKYIDQAGIQQTLDPSAYVVDNESVPGRLRLPYGGQWPDTRPQWDAVRIRYVVGWRTSETLRQYNPMPMPIHQALLLIISQMYENRTPEVDRTLSQVQFAVDALLAPYRLLRL